MLNLSTPLRSGRASIVVTRAFFFASIAGEYYEAHDVLEHLWLDTTGADHYFYKGLIQLAGGFVHLRKNFEHPGHPKHTARLAPGARLFRLAAKNIGAAPSPLHHGLRTVDVSDWACAIAAFLETNRYQVNPWNPATLPSLHEESSPKWGGGISAESTGKDEFPAQHRFTPGLKNSF